MFRAVKYAISTEIFHSFERGQVFLARLSSSLDDVTWMQGTRLSSVVYLAPKNNRPLLLALIPE